MKVCMIGSRHWSDRTKIKDTILALKKRFIEDLTIISGGNSYGADPLVRKYALEMDCKYKEFNVSPFYSLKVKGTGILSINYVHYPF